MGVFSYEGKKEGTPVKTRYFTAIGFSSVKMVADMVLIITSTGDKLLKTSTSMTLNDL